MPEQLANCSSEADSASTVVWDMPTRLFHWLFAASFAVAWFTNGKDRLLDVHVFAGYLFAALLAFRLFWGFAGGRYARFASFSFPAKEAWAYFFATLRGRARRHLGHNPAGSWAIWVLLVLGTVVSVSGLVTFGAEERHGPFAGLFGFSAGDVTYQVHEIAAIAMLAIVALHLAGVGLESWRHRESLVRAMITGRKTGAGVSSRRYPAVAAVLVAVVLAAGVAQFQRYARATPANPYMPFEGPALATNASWSEECGGCHLAFHPTLLPTRSWDAVFRTQHEHFGDDLALSGDTLDILARFARENAAETAPTEAAWKIARSVPALDAPRRITETRYWLQKHREIPEAIWTRVPVRSKANCAACHADAERGTFEDAAMRIPESQSF